MSALFIGLMSGTSVDALDAVLVDFSNERAPRLIGEKSHIWLADERQELLALAAGCADEIDRSGRDGQWWSERAAALTFKVGPGPNQPRALIERSRHFHLQAAFGRPRAQAEYFKNKACSIDNLYLEIRF